jgi:hypothetical protein
MKLTAGFKFINILLAIFCMNVVSAAFSSYVLALGRNLYEKALMKLTPGFNFINILLKAFMCEDPNKRKKD